MREEGGGFGGGHVAGDGQEPGRVSHNHHGGVDGGRSHGGVLTAGPDGTLGPISGGGTMVSGGTGGTSWLTDLGDIAGLEAWRRAAGSRD